MSRRPARAAAETAVAKTRLLQEDMDDGDDDHVREKDHVYVPEVEGDCEEEEEDDDDADEEEEEEFSPSDDDFDTRKSKTKPMAKARPPPATDKKPAKKSKTLSSEVGSSSTKSKPAGTNVRVVPIDDPACAPADAKRPAPVPASAPPPEQTSKAPATQQQQQQQQKQQQQKQKQPAAASSSKSSTAAASAAAAAPPSSGDPILDYLRALSAPTNAQGLADHFRGAMSKGEAERSLQSLVQAGKASTKDSGKVKLFWARQDGVAALTPAEEAQLAQELAAAKSQLASHQSEISRLQASIKQAKAVRSLSEAQAEAKKARAEAEAAEAELTAQRKELGGEGGVPMSAQEEAKVRKDYTRLRKAYLDRRRTCVEVLGQISEGTGKSEKKLMEDIGLESDADYGVVRTQFPPV
jgi:hypothetical protein